MITKYMIGLKCRKVSRPKSSQPKPFKSGLKVNTIKGLTINPYTKNFAFTFEEDDSCVDCKGIILLDDTDKPVHQNDTERQKTVHLKRFRKDLKAKLDSMTDEELAKSLGECIND